MLRVAASAPESEPGGFEPPMIAIEASRRAAERLWREIGVPAISYGPYPHGMGGADEYCELSELAVVGRVHHDFVAAQLLVGGDA